MGLQLSRVQQCADLNILTCSRLRRKWGNNGYSFCTSPNLVLVKLKDQGTETVCTYSKHRKENMPTDFFECRSPRIQST